MIIHEKNWSYLDTIIYSLICFLIKITSYNLSEIFNEYWKINN